MRCRGPKVSRKESSSALLMKSPFLDRDAFPLQVPRLQIRPRAQPGTMPLSRERNPRVPSNEGARSAPHHYFPPAQPDIISSSVLFFLTSQSSSLPRGVVQGADLPMSMPVHFQTYPRMPPDARRCPTIAPNATAHNPPYPRVFSRFSGKNIPVRVKVPWPTLIPTGSTTAR